MEGAPWYVGHDGKRVSNLSSHLYEIVHLPAAFTFWKIKDKANGTPLEFINWESIGKAFSALPRTRQHFVCKHTVGMCGVGKWMLRWKEWTSVQCPRCGMLEDASHVWKCQGKDANIVWEQALGSLQEWLASVQTDPDITSALCNGLKTWRLGQAFLVPPNHHLYCATLQQGDIGWGNLLEGWIAIEWETMQQEFYTYNHSRRTGRKWSVMLLQRIWQISRALWEHCNAILHQQENIVTKVQEFSLNRKIQRMYEDILQLALGPEDAYLRTLTLPVLLQKTWTYKSEWCKSAEIVIARTKRGRTSWSRNLRHMRSFMRRWLQQGYS